MNPRPLPRENRRSCRLDCQFPVEISHPVFGTLTLVARNLSAGGMFLETMEPLPLGTSVSIHFGEPGHEIVAEAEVRNHYFINFSDDTGPRALSGMGLRFRHFKTGEDRLSRLLH